MLEYKVNSKKLKVTVKTDSRIEYDVIVGKIMEYEGYIPPDSSFCVPEELELMCVKALVKNTNQWISGLISSAAGVISIDGIEVVPGSVCRYSGAKDSDGQKIYECDILMFADCGDCGVVKFDADSGMWSADMGEYSEAFYEFDFSTVKVVGNVLCCSSEEENE